MWNGSMLTYVPPMVRLSKDQKFSIAQHREEQAAEQSVREAFREQLLGATALHQADSFAIVLLERNLATERAEKALAIESNRLYEEEVGLLRDALPGGIFGHIGSFVRGLGTGVAAGVFIAKP